MSRAFQVNGEAMIYVKGPQGSLIANLSELGLSDNPVRIQLNPRFGDISLDAWGGPGGPPAEIQRKLSDAIVTFSLIHFDPIILGECTRLAMGGTVEGRTSRAGALMGNGTVRFAASNSFIGLNIASPVGQRPWRFYFAHLQAPIGDYPVGAEKTVVAQNWRAVPYTTDPWNGGLGASDYVLFDHVLDQ